MDILACPICGQPFILLVYTTKKIGRAGRDFPGCHNYCEYLSQKISSTRVKNKAFSHCVECYQEEVTEGLLKCLDGHEFPIHGAVPRLQEATVELRRTKKTFDVEWKVFSYNEKIYGHSKEEELQDFFRRTAIDEHFLSGKTVLDGGCGIGRLTQSVGNVAKEIIGIDFSQGVDAAYILNEEKPTVHILQGDIMNLPFKASSFDYVYSKGVLHYVPDVKRCISGLAYLVKPNGALSITLYPNMQSLFEAFNLLLTKFTLRLPIRVNYWLSHLLVPFLSLAWKWSGIERRKIDWNERAHMIFNWLSSEFQNRASNKEIAAWIRDIGFNDLRFSDIPVGITGIRSSSDQRKDNYNV